MRREGVWRPLEGDLSLMLVRGPFWIDGTMASQRRKPEEIVAKLRQLATTS